MPFDVHFQQRDVPRLSQVVETPRLHFHDIFGIVGSRVGQILMHVVGRPIGDKKCRSVGPSGGGLERRDIAQTEHATGVRQFGERGRAWFQGDNASTVPGSRRTRDGVQPDVRTDVEDRSASTRPIHGKLEFRPLEVVIKEDAARQIIVGVIHERSNRRVPVAESASAPIGEVSFGLPHFPAQVRTAVMRPESAWNPPGWRSAHHSTRTGVCSSDTRHIVGTAMGPRSACCSTRWPPCSSSGTTEIAPKCTRKS